MSASDKYKKIAKNDTISSSTTSNPALQIKAPKLPTKTEFSLDQEKANNSTEKVNNSSEKVNT